MIANKKKFIIGSSLMASFAVILVMIFLPLFNGHNGLNFMDNLYNSISKGSAYYIPKMKTALEPFVGRQVEVNLVLSEKTDLVQAGMLFAKGGAVPSEEGGRLVVSGDLKQILDNCLSDTDLMYHNNGPGLIEKYGYNEKQIIYNWYLVLKAMEKDLKRQKKFSEAKVVGDVIKKAVECSYNYYTIEPQKIEESMAVVLFSLVFYVVYTLWYGFAFMYLFEGWGLRLEH